MILILDIDVSNIISLILHLMQRDEKIIDQENTCAYRS